MNYQLIILFIIQLYSFSISASSENDVKCEYLLSTLQNISTDFKNTNSNVSLTPISRYSLKDLDRIIDDPMKNLGLKVDYVNLRSTLQGRRLPQEQIDSLFVERHAFGKKIIDVVRSNDGKVQFISYPTLNNPDRVLFYEVNNCKVSSDFPLCNRTDEAKKSPHVTWFCSNFTAPNECGQEFLDQYNFAKDCYVKSDTESCILSSLNLSPLFVASGAYLGHRLQNLNKSNKASNVGNFTPKRLSVMESVELDHHLQNSLKELSIEHRERIQTQLQESILKIKQTIIQLQNSISSSNSSLKLMRDNFAQDLIEKLNGDLKSLSDFGYEKIRSLPPHLAIAELRKIFPDTLPDLLRERLQKLMPNNPLPKILSRAMHEQALVRNSGPTAEGKSFNGYSNLTLDRETSQKLAALKSSQLPQSPQSSRPTSRGATPLSDSPSSKAGKSPPAVKMAVAGGVVGALTESFLEIGRQSLQEHDLEKCARFFQLSKEELQSLRKNVSFSSYTQKCQNMEINDVDIVIEKNLHNDKLSPGICRVMKNELKNLQQYNSNPSSETTFNCIDGIQGKNFSGKFKEDGIFSGGPIVQFGAKEYKIVLQYIPGDSTPRLDRDIKVMKRNHSHDSWTHDSGMETLATNLRQLTWLPKNSNNEVMSGKSSAELNEIYNRTTQARLRGKVEECGSDMSLDCLIAKELLKSIPDVLAFQFFCPQTIPNNNASENNAQQGRTQ